MEKFLLILKIFVLVLIIFLFLSFAKKSNAEDMLFERVIYGDTIVFDFDTKCRLLGIDTPEKFSGKKT